MLFASSVLDSYKASGKPLGKLAKYEILLLDTYVRIEDKLAMVASTVSSKMLEAIAAAEGFHFVECLTGKF